MVERPPLPARNPFAPSPWLDWQWNEASDPWFGWLGGRVYAPPHGPRRMSQMPLGAPIYAPSSDAGEPLTFWWEADPQPASAKFPWCNFFVRERKLLSYSSHRVPETQDRSVFRESDQRTKLGRTFHLWGTVVVINFLAHLYEQWTGKQPQHAILLGDISFYGGGDTPDHEKHEAGTEVDLYYLRTDRKNAHFQYRPGQANPEFDHEANAALLRAIYDAGDKFAKTVHPDITGMHRKTLEKQKVGLRYVYTDVEPMLKDARFKTERQANRLRPSNPAHGSPKHFDHFHATIT